MHIEQISSALRSAGRRKTSESSRSSRKHNSRRGVRDRPVMAMMVVGLIAKTMEYCQAQRDFELGGFHEHNPLLRPMLGHPTV